MCACIFLNTYGKKSCWYFIFSFTIFITHHCQKGQTLSHDVRESQKHCLNESMNVKVSGCCWWWVFVVTPHDVKWGFKKRGKDGGKAQYFSYVVCTMPFASLSYLLYVSSWNHLWAKTMLLTQPPIKCPPAVIISTPLIRPHRNRIRPTTTSTHSTTNQSSNAPTNPDVLDIWRHDARAGGLLPGVVCGCICVWRNIVGPV